jgi:hypothetical protein
MYELSGYVHTALRPGVTMAFDAGCFKHGHQGTGLNTECLFVACDHRISWHDRPALIARQRRVRLIPQLLRQLAQRDTMRLSGLPHCSAHALFRE